MKNIILIIEDEKPLRDALYDKLTREGFTAIIAKDGAEGLRIALRDHPDLLLLDIIMPVMDGITMLKKLRQDAWGKTARVIILTNLTADNYRVGQYLTQSKISYYLIKSDWKIESVIEKIRGRLQDAS